MKFNASGGSSGEMFLKLKDKDSVKGVFRGEPYDFRQHWKDKKPTDCVGPNCELCAAKQKSVFRFRLNFVMRDSEGNPTCKIFEQGWTVYEALKTLAVDYDLEKTFVKVSRSGSGMNDTVYNIVPLPQGQLTAEQDAAVALVPLHNLVNPVDEEHVQAAGVDEEVPF